MKKRYQDLVIKNGTFIGDWEKLYLEFENPWHQTDKSVINSISRRKVLDYIKKYNIDSMVEIGCGLGFTTDFLFQNSNELNILGVDISHNAIRKAVKKFPHLNFQVADILEVLKFNNYQAFFMSEISWYLLEDGKLNKVIEGLKKTKKYRFLIHNLTFYKSGQLYGNQLFSNLDEFLRMVPFYKLDYCSYTEPHWNHIETSVIFDLKKS